MLDFTNTEAVAAAFWGGVAGSLAALDDFSTRSAYEITAQRIRGDVFRVALGAFGGSVVASNESDPYPDDAAMRTAADAARRQGVPFRVSDVNHGHPLWSASDNYLFRVHHDACHVLGGPDCGAFDYVGELRTARLQASRLAPGQGPTDAIVRAVIMAEIVGQAAAFESCGVFPTAAGMQAVCLRPWEHGFGDI